MQFLAFISLLSIANAAQYSSVYSINNLPTTSEAGQAGYNNCGTSSSQSSNCQTVVLNSVEDFCLWAPPTPGQTIGDSERYEIAWCTQSGHGTRVMPAGTITGAHYVQTPHYIQITGVGNLSNLDILNGDAGGELDPHGADGNGNPIGGLVFSSAYGTNQVAEWTSFISSSEFCFRICNPASDAYLYCQHIYDLQGCAWNEPGNYGLGFDSCLGDSTAYPGIYVNNGVTSTYQQGDGSTPAPPAHPAGATSSCTVASAPGGAFAPMVTLTPAQVAAAAAALQTAINNIIKAIAGGVAAAAAAAAGHKKRSFH